MIDYKKDFIEYAIKCEVLKFGEFQLKSGRISPYFFNTGLFDSGTKLGKLGQFYAHALLASGIEFDILYGPAYKGIPLVSATAIAYAQLSDHDIPLAFNRKEAKDHGEGGVLVGAPLQGRVVIVDDVISAGTSVRESVAIIKNANAVPVGVMCALDRQEKGQGERSAVQEVRDSLAMPVVSIICLADIIDYLTLHQSEQLDAIKNYQCIYGV
jgi:orotate phosphoribosyltransferase